MQNGNLTYFYHRFARISVLLDGYFGNLLILQGESRVLIGLSHFGNAPMLNLCHSTHLHDNQNYVVYLSPDLFSETALLALVGNTARNYAEVPVTVYVILLNADGDVWIWKQA